MAGAMWAKARRQEDALAALRHGMWLHQRAGSAARARVVARIVRELESGGQSRSGREAMRRAA
jgi:adenine deaminase